LWKKKKFKHFLERRFTRHSRIDLAVETVGNFHRVRNTLLSFQNTMSSVFLAIDPHPNGFRQSRHEKPVRTNRTSDTCSQSFAVTALKRIEILEKYSKRSCPRGYLPSKTVVFQSSGTAFENVDKALKVKS